MEINCNIPRNMIIGGIGSQPIYSLGASEWVFKFITKDNYINIIHNNKISSIQCLWENAEGYINDAIFIESHTNYTTTYHHLEIRANDFQCFSILNVIIL